MAVKLIATYSKRLGLPGYSSHQFSVSVEIEISNPNEIAGESARLYQTLQDSVDQEIQHTGFTPPDGYGMANGAGHLPNGKGSSNGAWKCSEKQKELILKLIEEHHLDKAEIETLAGERFGGKGVKQLNKLEASGLIDEILERVGEKPQRGRGTRPAPPGYSRGRAR